MKIFFYGHAAGMGAGHFVRSLRLAAAAQSLGAEVMVVHPGPELSSLNRDGIPMLELPPLEKGGGLSLAERRGTILAQHLGSWKPDAVVCDTVPFGHAGEMLATLEQAREESWATDFWWGLPYAEMSRAAPLKNPRLRKALSVYRGVLAYAEQDDYDPVPPYRDFPLPGEVHHVGMVTETLPPLATKSKGGSATIACLVGSGGLDGAAVLVEKLQRLRPAGSILRYVAGPLARPEARNPDGVEVLGEADLATAVAGVDAVICRVGYNTAYALMTTDLPVLLVPTAWPEQFQRARQLDRLDSVLVWLEGESEEALAQRLAALLELPRVERRLPFRTDGAINAAKLLLARDCVAPGAARGKPTRDGQ